MKSPLTRKIAMLAVCVFSILALLLWYQYLKAKTDAKYLEENVLELELEEMYKEFYNLRDQIESPEDKKNREEIEKLKKVFEDVLEVNRVKQERRQKARVWYERGIGFLIGIFSSLVASFLYSKIE